MAIAFSLMMITGTVFGSLLVSSQNATKALTDQSQALDELRIAVDTIERQLRSAECIREPSAPNPGDAATGSRLRFTTRDDQGSYEVTYEVVGGELIQTRDASSRVVSAGPLVGAETAFEYLETPRRSVDLTFTLDVEDREDRQIATTVAGRNAWRSC